MTPIWQCWCWKLGLVTSLAMGGALALGGGLSPIAAFGDCALAQITPDVTLGTESSVVTPLAPGSTVNVIEGGATRGANLFHSFEQFSVPTGGAAHFNNALNVQNIISRVTGGSVSNIDGLIRANASANLFLLNPNGIIFGPNASLNIGGSFLGSTASSLNFADGNQFSVTAPQTTPLLTVSVPLGLQFGGNPGRILVQGDGQGLRTTSDLIDTTVGLRVQPNQTLALVGGDLVLEGGMLKTAGGRIEVGSVAGAGQVSLTPIDKGWALGYDDVQSFRDIHLSQQATVDASGAGGGDIQVRGRRMTLTDYSAIEASTLGSEPGGTLTVVASESVEAIGTSVDNQFGSGLFALVYPGATGTGGNLTVETGRLIIRDGAVVNASTFGAGAAGTVAVKATESVEVIGESADGQVASGLGTRVSQRATGAGGNLTIQTGRLIVQDGALVSVSTFGSGAAGTLAVTASESVELTGFSALDSQFGSSLGATVQPTATGAGGHLTIQTGRLIVQDGSAVSTVTFGAGQAGMLAVRASESVEVTGRSADGKFPSEITTSVSRRATGAGGNLTIQTGRLIIQDGAQIATNTLGSGAAGTLAVSASESVELSGTSADGQVPSLLTAQTTGIGSAGDLTIESRQLSVRDGAEVSVSSEGLGKAGNLQVQARSIQLDNQAVITATSRSGNGGDIKLQAQDLLLLRRNSNISSTAGTAQAGGNGGNIDIDTNFLVAVPSDNSDITANAYEGRGGSIQITAQGLFGTQFRDRLTLESDITASSEFGVDGVVEINTPDVDPSRGLATLPAQLVEASGLIATGCAADGENKFIVTGRGGLPPNPGDTLNSEAVLTNWATLEPEVENRSGAEEGATNPTRVSAITRIVEAQGWVINNKGEVVLTANAPNVTPNIPWITPATCHAP